MVNEREQGVKGEVSTQEAIKLFDTVLKQLRNSQGLQNSLINRFLEAPHLSDTSIQFESGGESWRLLNLRDSHSDSISLTKLGENKTEGIGVGLRYKAEPGGKLILEDKERVVDSFTIGHHIIDLEKNDSERLDQVINDQNAVKRIKDFISKL